jgi:hypothetical protein
MKGISPLPLLPLSLLFLLIHRPHHHHHPHFINKGIHPLPPNQHLTRRREEKTHSETKEREKRGSKEGRGRNVLSSQKRKDKHERKGSQMKKNFV